MSWAAPSGPPLGGLPPPPGAAGPVTEARSPLRRLVRWLGIVCIVGGVGAGAFLFVMVFVEGGRTVEGFARGPIPEARLRLEPGSYTLFIEGPGLTDEDGNDNCRRCGEVRAAAVEVRTAEGRPVPLRPYGGTNTYDLGGHEGVAHSTLRIDDAGTYLVRVRSALGRDVAIGEYRLGGLVVDALLAFGVAGLGVTAGVLLLVRSSR